MPILILPVRKPFDWLSLLAFLRFRATPGVETVTDSEYTRTILIGSTPYQLSVGYDFDNATLQISHTADEAVTDEIISRVRRIFKIDQDIGPIETFLQQDSWLTSFVSRQSGLRVPGGWSPFEITIRAVLGQQVSVPAATTLMGRVVRMAGTQIDETAWLFPTPEQVLRADLSRLGVPQKRLETVKALAAFFAENGDDCLARPEIEKELLCLDGIGKWTVGYILMRSGSGHDHWPEGDLVLRKAMSESKILISPKQLIQKFAQWSPYRSYATIHIWKGYTASQARTASAD